MSPKFAASSRPNLLNAFLTTTNQTPLPANDDCNNPLEGQTVQAALRHFAVHGLNAARAARAEAERAFFKDDRAAYDHWMAITRILDRSFAANAPCSVR